MSQLQWEIDKCGPDIIQDTILRETRNFFGEPTASLMHRLLFDRFGLFNAKLAQLFDLECWISVSINTGLPYIADPLATFRYHASSTSAGNRNPLKDERVSVFDRLVIDHELAYNPHYAKLRERVLHGTPKRNFQREFAKKAVWVNARARALANQHNSPDQCWIKQWSKLAERYPRLASSPWHLPYKARDIWIRHIGWRH